MFALILAAVSLGMTNFAGALAIGVSGVDARLRLRVVLAFGLFEGGMPLVGLLLGRAVADSLGSHSNLLAGVLLGLTGIYTMFSAMRHGPAEALGPRSDGTARLLATGLALSVDNLVVGFALGSYHVSFVVAAAVIATVSVVLSLVGLELGGRLGAQVGRRSELLGGALLLAIGCAIGIGLI
jgi:putative Mn2+ efflux pump MntP